MTQMEMPKDRDFVRGGEFIVQNGAPVDYAREHIGQGHRKRVRCGDAD